MREGLHQSGEARCKRAGIFAHDDKRTENAALFHQRYHQRGMEAGGQRQIFQRSI